MVPYRAMFRRHARSERVERHQRSEVSLISEVLDALAAMRGDDLPVPPDRLPIAVGASLLHADMVAAMPPTSPEPLDQRQRRLLAQPDPEQPRELTTHQAIQSAYWTGRAFLLLDQPAPRTTSFRVLPPAFVAPEYDPLDPLRVTAWNVNGERWPIGGEGDRIYQVKILDDPRRGPLGESPLSRCHEALTLYGYAYRYLVNWFVGGGLPSLVLKTATERTPAEATQLIESWTTARRERRPAVMGPLVNLEIPETNGELASILTLLDHASAEFGRALNLPGSLVNAPSLGAPLTYTNTADEFRRWLAISLGPTWCRAWRLALSRLSGAVVELDSAPALQLFADATAAAAGEQPAPPAQPAIAPVRQLPGRNTA